MNNVCVKCKVEYRPDRVGVIVIEMMGTEQESRPYRIWSADLHTCPGCGHSIIAGFALRPTIRNGDPGFDEYLQEAEANRYSYKVYERPVPSADEDRFDLIDA